MHRNGSKNDLFWRYLDPSDLEGQNQETVISVILSEFTCSSVYVYVTFRKYLLGFVSSDSRYV